jgi:hypothetical protein
MRTKQPTIEDIYMADAYITTPGVRQGLLERAAEGNDDEVITEDTDDGQVVYYRTPYGEMMPVGRPIMLAAGPTNTMSDAGTGMPSIKPTPRNPVMGGIADFVRNVRDLANQYEIKDFVPLLGGMGVGDLLMGKSPEELENWAYGNSPIAMPPRGTGGLVPVVKTGRKEGLADTMFLGLDAAGFAKGAGAAGRAGARAAGRAIDQAMVEGTGPAASIIPQAVRPLGMVGNDVSYRSSHAAPNREFGATLDDLTGGGQIYPADVYSKQGPRIYGTGTPYDKKAFDIANKAKGNPDAEVTIYRAVPSEVTSTEINRGDWVAITQEYARDHGESVLRGDYKIITKKVKARDIYTNGDSIQEWGYDPAEKGTK